MSRFVNSLLTSFLKYKALTSVHIYLQINIHNNNSKLKILWSYSNLSVLLNFSTKIELNFLAYISLVNLQAPSSDHGEFDNLKGKKGGKKVFYEGWVIFENKFNYDNRKNMSKAGSIWNDKQGLRI